MKTNYWVLGLIALFGLIAGIGLFFHDPAWRYHALVNACWTGNRDKVGDLLKGGADPNGLKDFNLNPTREFTYPIYGAAWNNHPKIIDLLVQAGAEVNVSDSEGGSPLCTAAREGSLEAVKVLLFHGAHARTESGSSTAAVARRFGHDDIADLIEATAAQTSPKHEK
jgi:uncharacterized protein